MLNPCPYPLPISPRGGPPSASRPRRESALSRRSTSGLPPPASVQGKMCQCLFPADWSKRAAFMMGRDPFDSAKRIPRRAAGCTRELESCAPAQTLELLIALVLCARSVPVRGGGREVIRLLPRRGQGWILEEELGHLTDRQGCFFLGKVLPLQPVPWHSLPSPRLFYDPCVSFLCCPRLSPVPCQGSS